jgi:hypothetical protein
MRRRDHTASPAARPLADFRDRVLDAARALDQRWAIVGGLPPDPDVLDG